MIMICTTSYAEDSCISLVREAIAARGGEVVHLDTDLFPAERSLSLEWNDVDRLTFGCREGLVESSELSAVWVRHMEPGAQEPEEVDPDFAPAIRVLSEVVVWDVLECLDVFCLDPVGALRNAPQIARQLQLARRFGLDIPRSIVSNDPEAVRRFAATCPHGVITKLPDSAAVSIEGEEGEEPVYTRIVSEEELETLDGLELCPMVFQERIPKAKELRLTIVGDKIFSASIEGEDGDDLNDWRSEASQVGAFRPYDGLPKAVEEGLFRLLDYNKLNFGTVDIIVSPEGRHVFLECNTISFFDFVEDATGLPISGAIADLLLGVSSPRV